MEININKTPELVNREIMDVGIGVAAAALAFYFSVGSALLPTENQVLMQLRQAVMCVITGLAGLGFGAAFVNAEQFITNNLSANNKNSNSSGNP